MTYKPGAGSGYSGGTVKDTGPPRSAYGFSGLGAVGGPRGVGAGALRVIVEFLTQYNADEVKRLEADINKLQQAETRNNRILSKENQLRVKEQSQLTRIQNLQARARVNFTRAQLKEIKDIRDLERSGNRGAIKEANQRKAALAQQTGFRKAEITGLVNQDRIEQRITQRREQDANRVAAAENRIRNAKQQQIPIQQRLSAMERIRGGVVPRLGALALGAVGGIFGGAIVGVGFAAAQAGIDAVGKALKDIIDPAADAREVMNGVAKEIRSLADAEGTGLLEASAKYMEQMNLSANEVTPELLAQSAALTEIEETMKAIKELEEGTEENERRRLDLIRDRAEMLTREAGGRAVDVQRIRNAVSMSSVRETLTPAELAILETAISEVDESIDALTNSAGPAAQAVEALARAERAAAVAADIAAAGQQRFVSAVQRVSGLRIQGLQDQLEAADTGPSARTQALESQLEGIATASQNAAYASQLQQIQEQRALVLLEQRIRFQGQAIRMDQLSARGQMVAIDARIEALGRAGMAERAQLDALNARVKAAQKADQAQDKRDREALEVYDDKIEAINKQGEAQDRLNKLLDLQYRLNQVIRRNEGESISDFIQRRANEARGLLAEQDSLERQTATDAIQVERDRVAAIQEAANEKREQAIEAMQLEAEQLQATIERIEKARQAEIDALNQRKEQLALEVQLNDLAEQEKQLKAQETQRIRVEALQNELEASKAADEAELESRRKAIEAQIEDEKRRAEEVTFWSDKAEQDRLRAMILGARTQTDAASIMGEVSGATRAYEELKAYLKGINVSPLISEQILGPLRDIVELGRARLNAINQGYNRPTPNAKGGVFMLNNAMNNPFGANIRTGEEGQEIGVVLSNRVARILQEQQGSKLPPMSITVNRSTDPWRDGQRTKKLIKDVIKETIG